MLVGGTRPEAIKLAPVMLELGRRDIFSPALVVTAQHREMLDGVLAHFGLDPLHDLDVHVPGQPMTEIAASCIGRLGGVIEKEQPAGLVVQGDTLSAFAGAYAAFLSGVPVFHVEAGLRTGDRQAPFPEEANRTLISHLASLHFAPTEAARANLLREGIDPASIVVTGNTVIDALQWTLARPGDIPARVAEHEGPVVVVTAHRRESWGAPLREIAGALEDLARARPDALFYVAAHQNPLVRGALQGLVGLPNVEVAGPSDYATFCRLLERATILLTDSGGIQEEGPSLGKPVLVMRDTTERPEAVEAGTVRLVGTDRVRIVEQVVRLLTDPAEYAGMARAHNPYGDGHASERIADALAHFFGLGPPAVAYQSDEVAQ
jgi:UDP-N-acetylglucosamine 2-epimerase (non-hydrolysing)